jgi:type II secretory pathway pseudopilin PulG
MHATRSSQGQQRGMALADLLLAIAVLAMVLAAAMPLLARQGDELAAKAIADDLRLFRIGAEEHFKSNRAAYEAAMVDGTGAGQLCRLGVNPVDGSGGTQANSTTLHTCAVDGTQLAYLRALPSGLRPRNVYGESWVAIHRLVDGAGSPSAGVETLFVSAAVASGGGALPLDPQRWQIARSAAAQMDRGGGGIPDTDRSTCIARRAVATYQACGDGWTANLARFVNATELGQFGNRLPN